MKVVAHAVEVWGGDMCSGPAASTRRRPRDQGRRTASISSLGVGAWSGVTISRWRGGHKRCGVRCWRFCARAACNTATVSAVRVRTGW